MGDTIQTLAINEQKRIDDVRLTEAETQLMQAETELEADYRTKKNGDVLQQGFHQGYQEKYQQAANAIGEKLVTPGQKQQFQMLTNRRRAGYDAKRVTYAMGETERYESAVFNSRIDLLTKKGADSYKDPSALATAALELEDSYVKEMTRKGLKDPAILTAELSKVRGAFWGNVLDRAITDEDYSAANMLFATAGSQLPDDKRREIGTRLNIANEMVKGTTIAETALGMQKAGSSAQDIELFIAKEAGSNKGVYNAAQTVLTNIKQAEHTQRQEAEGTMLLDFQKGGATFAAMKKVTTSASFAQLDAGAQAKLMDTMLSDARQTQTYNLRMAAEAKEAERAKFDTLETFSRYQEVLDSPEFPKMTQAQLMSYRSTLGPQLTSSLLKTQKEVVSGAAKFQIDKDILNMAMPEDALKTGNKDKQYAFRGIVEQELQNWKAANPGKVPSMQEQMAIARSGLKEYNIKGVVFDSTKKAYELTDKDRAKIADQAKADAAKARKEAADRAKFEREIQAEARKNGGPLTPKQIEEAWKLKNTTPSGAVPSLL
jgi:hypothetical protein